MIRRLVSVARTSARSYALSSARARLLPWLLVATTATVAATPLQAETLTATGSYWPPYLDQSLPDNGLAADLVRMPCGSAAPIKVIVTVTLGALLTLPPAMATSNSFAAVAIPSYKLTTLVVSVSAGRVRATSAYLGLPPMAAMSLRFMARAFHPSSSQVHCSVK